MTLTYYAIYDSTTGEIRSYMSCDPSEIAASTPSGCSYLALTSLPDGEWYIDLTSTPTITAKPAFTGSWSSTSITADGVSSASISSLPNPTTIQFDSFPGAIDAIPNHIETSGTFSFTTTYPGSYTVRVMAFPYTDFITTITAT